MPAVAGGSSRPLTPSRWSACTAAVALADGYWTSPPHEAPHPFNALGALWADGAPASGVTLEARASIDGVAWTAWQALPLDGDGPAGPHSTLLFVPTSRVAQYRL